MLCLGLKKSLLPPRLKLTAQGLVQCTNVQSWVWYHSGIQAPQESLGTELVNFIKIIRLKKVT